MGALKGGSATHISIRAPDSFLVSLLSKFNPPDLGISAGNLDAISCLKATNCHPKEGLQQGQVCFCHLPALNCWVELHQSSAVCLTEALGGHR